MVKLKDKDYITGDIAKQLNIDKMTIIAPPAYEELITPDGKSREAAVMLVRIPNGSEWLYTPNKTSRKACKAEWGDELDNWINKELVVSVKEEKVMGKDKLVIYTKPFKVDTIKIE